MVKPPHLYHASQNKNIDIFEPRAESVRDPNEGPVVFATPNKSYASMFIANSDDIWTSKGQYNGQWYHAISDKVRFISIDKGGAIYTLPSETFETDLTKGMKSNEWVSKVPVKPITKEDYNTCLEAMLLNGVKVLFVSQEIFADFRQLLRSGKVEEAFDLLFAQP